jgi:tetratricopeptide (TPR) repeat protein/TolB-like protein
MPPDHPRAEPQADTLRAWSSLVATELVAGRFEIVRFIGHGAMGAVYEAQDRELGERIALKTIRAEIANDPATRERFKHEIQLARRVTHPNVCRVFDIVHHHRPSDPGSRLSNPDVTFVTMELLKGETLSERLRRIGRFTSDEALPIVEQLAAGLSAAHKAGVVHCDFKSSNVMLVPDAGEVRAVVMDFGLARARPMNDGDTRTASLMANDAGTPAYMAPEQVEGYSPTAASDQYALGIVMYEMVTGVLPFRADTPLSAAIKRLHHDPPPPREFVPDLDASWESAILRCLDRDPAGRFDSVAAVPLAVRGELEPARAVRSHRHVVLAWTLAAVLATIVVAGVARQWRVASPPSGPAVSEAALLPSTTPRRPVAVIGFRNLSGRADSAWLSTAFAEMLTTELAAGQKLRTIPGEDVTRMKIELALADSESYAKDTLSRIRKNLGTDLVVLGSYVAIAGSDRIRLDLRLQDAVAGVTLVSFTDTGSEADLLDLIARTGERLRRELGVAQLSANEAVGVKASQPANADAARLYAQGLEKLRLFDAPAARVLLEQAVAADPANPLAHSALAAAWQTLGYDAKAREEAKIAVDRSAGLPRVDQLWVKGRYYEAAADWANAIETYRTLFNFLPDSLEYGLRLVVAERSGSRVKDALATLDALRTLPPPARDDPRIDLEEAYAAGSLTQFPRARDAAARAAAKSEALGARLLQARALLEEGWELWHSGQPDQGVARSEIARQIFADAGDRTGAAKALGNIAFISHMQGAPEKARRLYEEVLAVHRQTGNERDRAWALNGLANLLVDQGDTRGAKQMYGEALDVYRRTASEAGQAGTLGNIASVLQYEGDLAGSRRMHEASLALYRKMGARMNVAIELTNIGTLLVDQGDLGAAHKHLDEALTIKREVGNKSSIAFTLTSLANLLMVEGDLAGARKAVEEALALRTELAQKARVAGSRLDLAEVTLEEGHPRDAAVLARQTIEAFRSAGSAEDEALAHALVARAALAQGNTGEAKAEADRAVTLMPRMDTRSRALLVAIAAARVKGRGGDARESLKSLNSTVAEANRLGLVGVALEARLALGETELAAGRRSEALARLATLKQDADARGFKLIARKAAAAISRR